MFSKFKLLWSINLYKLQSRLGLKKTDIMSTINDYYRVDFNKLEKKDIAVILPHCLINEKCPAKFSKSDGVLCNKCKLCGCGKVRESAEEKGYQFYISPSVGFTKRLTYRKKLKGIIGVACDYEIEKGIHSEKLNNSGVKLNGSRIKTQGLRLQEYNCIDNNVDWDKVEELMES